jgi:hypothetical protein
LMRQILSFKLLQDPNDFNRTVAVDPLGEVFDRDPDARGSHETKKAIHVLFKNTLKINRDYHLTKKIYRRVISQIDSSEVPAYAFDPVVATILRLAYNMKMVKLHYHTTRKDAHDLRLSLEVMEWDRECYTYFAKVRKIAMGLRRVRMA